MNGVYGAAMGKWTKYSLVARTSLSNSMAYTAGFIFSSFFYAFVLLIFIGLWGKIYRSGTILAGYSYPQMIWYFIVTEMITLSRSNVFEELSQEIKSGGIAYLLNKPFNYLVYQGANGGGPVLLKLAINAGVGLTVGWIFIGPLPGFDPRLLPWMGLAFAGGMLLNFLAMACLGLSAFWLEENTAFYWIYQKLGFILGVFLPLEFLPVWAQHLARILPFSYVSYGPAKLAVAFSPDAAVRILAVQWGYILGLAILAGLIYRKGVKRINVNGG